MRSVGDSGVVRRQYGGKGREDNDAQLKKLGKEPINP